MSVKIQRMDFLHVEEVAALHRTGIDRGFLTRLGPKLLADLYGAINRSALGFVFVAVGGDGRIVGFVSGTTRTKGLYRSILLRRGWRYAGLVLKKMFSPGVLRGIVQTVLYPVRGASDTPEAELLSIVVSEELRGTTVAADLLTVLLDEFRRRGCDRVKLMVGESMGRAHAFYLKHGFVSAGTMQQHGHRSDILVIELAG
ncbi:MAG: GNAT family N-acetyltransferase [Planctomycetes bacterium]|nr:GNAT family N-acetyltransferase [Planctomycetota bacterium]